MALTQISTNGIKDANVNTADIADDAVTTAKIDALAVTNVKIANNAVGTNKYINSSITTAKIADDAVTEAKLANSINSAIAANTAKTETTINNNADNRVITGSGTANTLNGEANLTYDGNAFISTQTTSTSDCKFIIRNSNTPATGSMRLEFHHGTGTTEGTNRFRYGFVEGIRQDSSNAGALGFGTKANNAASPSEKMRLDKDGRLLINTTTLSQSKTPMLEVKSDSNTSADFAAVFSSANGTSGTGISYSMIDAFNNTNNATLRIRTNGADAMHVSDTQNIGIGTTNPGQKLEVRQTAASHAIIAANRPNSDTFAVALGNTSAGEGVVSVNNADLVFGRDFSGTFTERMRMRNAGGLCFNGDTAELNALDDYEEGTWTVVVKPASNQSAFTYGASNDYELRSATSSGSNGATSTASYTKIGNRVFISFSIYMNTGGTSRLNFSLPYAIKGNDYQAAGHLGYYKIAGSAGVGFLGNGLNSIDVFELDGDGNHPNLSYASNSEIYINLQYETN